MGDRKKVFVVTIIFVILLTGLVGFSEEALAKIHQKIKLGQISYKSFELALLLKGADNLQNNFFVRRL